MAPILVGISGWTFDDWRGAFYPEGLRAKDELAYASRLVSAIEINGTFHSLMRPPNYQSWYEQTPAGFVFAVKGPKYITHQRRLKDFETPLSNFLASGLLALGEKLGPILWQFPPSLPFTVERFEPFLAALPRDMAEAARLGTGHSTWLEGRTFLAPPVNHVLRHAVEGRHASFRSEAFVELARKYGVAVVVSDTAGRWPHVEDVTSDFVYLRLHGDETKYPDGYTKAALEHFAERFRVWAAGGQPADADLVVPGEPAAVPRPVYAFFDNDVKELAPLNALSMITHLTRLGLAAPRDLELPAVAAKRTSVATAEASAKPHRAAQPKAPAKQSDTTKPRSAAKPKATAKPKSAAKPKATAKRAPAARTGSGAKPKRDRAAAAKRPHARSA